MMESPHWLWVAHLPSASSLCLWRSTACIPVQPYFLWLRDGCERKDSSFCVPASSSPPLSSPDLLLELSFQKGSSDHIYFPLSINLSLVPISLAIVSLLWLLYMKLSQENLSLHFRLCHFLSPYMQTVNF